MEIITLPSEEILAMGVEEAGKWAAGPMAEKLASREWNFGSSPGFEASIKCGEDDLRLTLQVSSWPQIDHNRPLIDPYLTPNRPLIVHIPLIDP